MSEENKPAEMLDVKPEVEKAFDVLAEINTILTYKNEFKPEHLATKGAEIVSELAKLTGVQYADPTQLTTKITELEALANGKESKIGELSKSLETLNETIKAKDAELEKLSSSLNEFKGIQIGKNKVEPAKTVDHKEIYDALKADGKHIEASDYYRKNLMPLKKA